MYAMWCVLCCCIISCPDAIKEYLQKQDYILRAFFIVVLRIEITHLSLSYNYLNDAEFYQDEF